MSLSGFHSLYLLLSSPLSHFQTIYMSFVAISSVLCRCFKTCVFSNRALNIHLFMISSFSDFMCILIHIISPFASVVGEIVVPFAIATLRKEKINKTFHFYTACHIFTYNTIVITQVGQ